ncbi:MAG: cyclic nucleotide-binding domain-containing protein [Bacteroidales bacterium]|nr:cyclic nucleotide-binding domain-containing protein [Bacteroidales bacterium]
MTDKMDLSQLHQLSASNQELLRHKKKQLVYQKGENIFKQGAFAPYVMFVQTGLVKLYLQTGHNKQINIRVAKPGDLLAFSSVFGEDSYTYSSLALKDSEICMIDKEGLKQVLYDNNEFAMKITSSNFKNEKHLLNIISSISHKQMRGKLATALLYLSAKEFLDEQIFQYLSRQDIANFASITAESAIKFLKEFEKEGIIKIKGKDITIEKLNELKDISEKG